MCAELPCLKDPCRDQDSNLGGHRLTDCKGLDIYYGRGGDGSKLGGLRKISGVRGGVYEKNLPSLGGSMKKNMTKVQGGL